VGRIPEFSATGSMQSDANPIPASGIVFSVDVVDVPPDSGVMLPQYSSPYISCLVQNSSLNNLLIYPLITGTIDGSLAPFMLAGGANVLFWSLTAYDWVSFVGGGASGGGSFIAPAFTSFGISGQASPLEIGDSISSGSKNFVWTTSQPSNVELNSISITDLTTSTLLGSGLPNSGLAAITIGSITNTTPTAHSWQIAGTDTQGGSFSRSYTATWLPRAYWGASANVTLTGPQVAGLASSQLQAGSAGSYPEGAGGYKYLCFDLSEVQPALVKDQLTNFNIPLADVSDNAAYSNVNGNGLTYALVTVTNTFSVATQYAVYRSKNASASAPTFVVT
jgi:hypothetical protein